MIGKLALVPSRRAIRRLDAVVLTLVLIFGGLGVLAGVELARLARFSASLLDVATALDQVGQSLAVLAQVPLVGSGIESFAVNVQQTAASTRDNASEAAASVRTLAVAVGLAIVLVPLAPLLIVYLPLRGARLKEIRGLQRLLAARPVDPALVAHLAHGTVARLPYARLRQITQDPWGDLVAGRHHELAAAELRRLGIPSPPDWPTVQPPVAGRRER